MNFPERKREQLLGTEYFCFVLQVSYALSMKEMADWSDCEMKQDDLWGRFLLQRLLLSDKILLGARIKKLY